MKKARNSCPPFPSPTLSPFVHPELKACQEQRGGSGAVASCDSSSSPGAATACTVQCTPGKFPQGTSREKGFESRKVGGNPQKSTKKVLKLKSAM